MSFQQLIELVYTVDAINWYNSVTAAVPATAPTDPATMSKEQALKYVTSLEEVSMVGHISAGDRCPFCWGAYDGSDADPQDDNDLAVYKTPCNHLYHRGCLTQILEGSSTLCSVCARELNV